MRRTLLLVAGLAACVGETDTTRRGQETPAQQSAAGPPTDVRATPEWPERFGGIGRAPSASEVRAWDIDANASGKGLPRGRGTYARGAQVYAQQCASCHGPKGEGMPPNPKLVSAPISGFPFAQDYKIPKTIGTYWPYATTLYDYINRAMPFATPGSLPPDDVYSVVAWLLAENGIIKHDVTIDAKSLPKVRMPARDRFVVDDRVGGTTFK